MLDEKFGGGNVIIETLAVAVVSSAKPPSTDSTFPNYQLLTSSARTRRMSWSCFDILTDRYD